MMKETSAYCNSLYRLTLLDELDENHTVIAKVFSQLALQRMEPFRQTGDIDRRVAVEGLGPAILATTDGAILMEDCSAGRVLTEEDVHSENAATISKSVALSLAHLHHLAEESAVRHENMLWRACDVMFSLSDRNWKVADWNIDRLCRSLQTHREQLEKEDPVQVDFGHGDCKPSNVLFFPTASGSPQILFIDWEISGKHYRAFDLAKFLRADQPTAHTEKNRRFFLKAYAAASQRLVDKKTTVVVASDNLVDTLEREVSLLTPLTWLEAALFFVCMSTQDPLQEKKWNDLALDRLKSYERCCHSLKTAADGP
jgi:thiamine kinase-like enzyme